MRVYLRDMTRPHFLCLLAGTALTGISVGRWSRPVVVTHTPVAAAVAVAKAPPAVVSRKEERSWLTRIQTTESNVNFANLWAELQRSNVPRAWKGMLEEVLLEHWVTFDLSGCLERCNDLPLETKPGVPWIGSALAAFAKRDAKMALKLADAVDRKFPPDQRLQLRELSSVVAKLDPVGFLSGKFELPRKIHETGRNAALETLARTSADQAVKLAQRYPSAATGEAALGHSASVIASAAAEQMGNAAALTWADSLNGLTREDRQTIRAELMNRLAAHPIQPKRRPLP